MTDLTDSVTTVRMAHRDLVTFAAAVFADRGVPTERAHIAAEALCYGDLAGMASHGTANLTRLYLPAIDEGRIDPAATPEVLADTGAAVLLDGKRALGLWSATDALDLAANRARETGIAMVSVRNATHFGCAGFHTGRLAQRHFVSLLASNCGRQRIARAPGGRPAVLGTNPLSVASPTGRHHPYVLDMSTTVVPTGRIRAAHRAGQAIPEGWLEDADGRAVTDPGALDRREGYLRWLGGDPATGAYKGYGLGLLVEVLAALVPGAGLGPEPAALTGDGGPTGSDDDIGFVALVVAPGALRPIGDFLDQADGMFSTLLDCPRQDEDRAVSYPGWHEAEQAARSAADGVDLPVERYRELRDLAAQRGLDLPRTGGVQ
ncbi:Ldh family oxidoreductase [Actinocrispum wychmicini]|uniref:LDH2 family malate/lactate/ureidoglycolate dehydrogenase n=1 Tax=Actinocrispum wychmicini TaxID=1213861 RepID=A0A4V2S7G1_9PSEU|nr:Ldh family oxidoreductase [Actinocrispum wychmicini]TCO59790.1 LDH2 family malate/lactate/ureidoglycolate dehydrogenase [Actinocrispum wychmicini]